MKILSYSIKWVILVRGRFSLIFNHYCFLRINDLLERLKKTDSEIDILKEDNKKNSKLKEDFANLKAKLDELQRAYDKKCKECRELETKLRELIIINEKNVKFAQNLENDKRTLLNENHSLNANIDIINV